ncbi:STAS domain-containing protein [Brevundimonas bacteroides]|uniref:STAS domain-containing protein n=1 Tax=Brevundimonas bacteroides TaxID=74311 RepID=UPI0006898998|nr:STAS domain-containing protein [Brevundimonas bacteroides]
MSRPAVLELPARLDPASLELCLGALKSKRGAALDLDGASVERLGGLGVQLLLSAVRTWREDSQPLRLLSPSAALLTGLSHLGVEPETLPIADAHL